MLIKEIAEACGFENERHFSMYFKKCEGVSPEAYRKCHAKQYAACFSQKPRGIPEKVEPVSKIPAECLGIKPKHHDKSSK
ncbi:MAG: helix-turn-helix domain-containing protein, partial [Kiritimatiellae bacterium]|nr:helix-turn-helix domain-containing protein [Kiritimatiellia bacterium]